MKIRSALLVLALLFVSACSKADPAPAPAAPDTPAPRAPADPGVPRGPGTPAGSLFPGRDLEVVFRVWDLGAAAEAHATQHLLREPDRLAVIYNGRPYFTWTLDESGVWREDPKNPGTMLRYLPPELHDGLTWSQVSGDATVWFQTTRLDSSCPAGNNMGATGCWRLTVVNRGELLIYVLAPGVGPVQVFSTNARDERASFRMQIETSTRSRLQPDQRAELLAGDETSPLPRSPVTGVTPEQFVYARDGELGFHPFVADLDGDGLPETVSGIIGRWNLADVELFAGDGVTGATPVATISPFLWAHKVIPVKLLQPDVTVLLEWQLYPDRTEVGIRWLRSSEGTYQWRRLTGWGLKHAEMTRATRADLSADGLLTVEWDMGDPARHTRVRRYQLDLDAGGVGMVSETLRPQEVELRYPSDPEGVLQAAYVAAIHQLEEEMPRYFGSAAVQEAFQEMAGSPQQEVSSIQLVRATVLDYWCNTDKEPVAPGPDGTAPFLIQISGSPIRLLTMGTVTFTSNPQGRTVIQAFAVTGHCPER